MAEVVEERSLNEDSLASKVLCKFEAEKPPFLGF